MGFGNYDIRSLLEGILNYNRGEDLLFEHVSIVVIAFVYIMFNIFNNIGSIVVSVSDDYP